jgi:hypothetical protein
MVVSDIQRHVSSRRLNRQAIQSIQRAIFKPPDFHFASRTGFQSMWMTTSVVSSIPELSMARFKRFPQDADGREPAANSSEI